jgi:hypothetical protein
MLLAAALLALGGQVAVSATPAQDVADVSSRVCYGLVSGLLAMPAVTQNGGVAAEEAELKAFDLTYGLDKVAIDGLGQGGTAMVSRSTMAQRVKGSARTVLTVGPTGCRTLLVADPDPTITGQVSAALVASGWRAGPPAGIVSPAVERRMFLRRDATNKPYLLNLQTLKIESGRLRLFTTVAAIPAGVQLPQGY